MIHIRTTSLKDCISTVIFNKYVVYGSFRSQKCAKIMKIEENMVKFSKFSYSKKYTTIHELFTALKFHQMVQLDKTNVHNLAEERSVGSANNELKVRGKCNLECVSRKLVLNKSLT